MKTLPLYHDRYPHTGEGESQGELVLLHGWGMNNLVWDEFIPFLNEQFDINLIDLPGMGRSPIPACDYNLEFLVDRVTSVAPDRAVWIGWSLGALVVQKVLLDKPEQVQAAYCMAGTPCFLVKEDWPFAMPVKVFEKFQALLEEDWQGTIIRFLTLQCKGSDSIREDTRKLRERVFHHGFPASKALREGLNILRDHDLRSELERAQLDTSLHYILGQFDTLIPVQASKDIAALNAAIRVHEIPGASHVPQLSHPRQVAEIFSTTIKGGY